MFHSHLVCSKYVLLTVCGNKSEACFYIRHRFPDKWLGILDENLLGEGRQCSSEGYECLERQVNGHGKNSEHFHVSDINIHSH